MVSTSQKSLFIVPSMVIISAILLVAVVRISSALQNASLAVVIPSAYISLKRSLLITNNASTFSFISLTPLIAFTILGFISNWNGIVTIPIVNIPISFAIWAIMGAAPVPVPPPIPAVINTIWVVSLKRAFICSMLVSAAARPFSGLPPAPRPVSPNCILVGTLERLRAWLSVLHIAKETSLMPWLYIFFTAFPPPPPTPITFIMLEAWFLIKSNSIIPSMIIFPLFYQQIAWKHHLPLVHHLQVIQSY